MRARASVLLFVSIVSFAALEALGALAAPGTPLGAISRSDPPRPKRMSVHNRLLLNRLAVSGHRTVEVMIAVDRSEFDRVSALIEHVGGRLRRSEPSIGYARADLPTEKLVELVADPGIDAYQISSLSRGSWYRDGPPEDNAEMFRGFEVAPSVGPAPGPRAGVAGSDLPPLSPQNARESGYTADDDAGVGDWMATHPTFDGRGVTIALLESARAEFGYLALESAKTLDGTTVPKLAGVLNAVDPEEKDETLVDLVTQVRAVTTWCRVGHRTYIVPRPGTYRFGLFTLSAGGNVVHEFAVLEDQASGEIRVDANGDADFRNDAPLVDANTRLDVHALTVRYPRQASLPFVVTRGPGPHQLRILTSGNGHQAMTVSVAAGTRTADGLAYGVAPAARVLLVKVATIDVRLGDFFEGYLDAVKRSDVDIVCDSTGITMVPDTESDFSGLFFRRLVAVYGKPVFHSAGNSLLLLNGVSSLGSVFSVGGSMSPATFSALFGGGTLSDTIVHPMSASGPAMDGALKPDFLAPVHRIAAGPFAGANPVLLPKNAPTRQLPSGYGISCCTSATSPYAAGVAALLLSAAKQERLPYSMDTLGRALSAGARFLPGWSAHQQGSGVLDVAAAWRELNRAVEIPRIRVTGDNVYALAPYAASGGRGVGLFEREGWHAGARGQRILRFRRESGEPGPATYPISWTGNDGTFGAARSLTLPLNEDVSLRLDVVVSTAGAHSAILNLHDPATDSIVLRAEATIVAAETFDRWDRTVRFTGSVPMMRSVAHYVTLPEGAAAVSIELEVTRGVVHAVVLPSHGLMREYYGQVTPQAGRMAGKGRYRLLLPSPAPGTWSVTLINDSAWREPNHELVSTEDAQYSISVELLAAAVVIRPAPSNGVIAAITNQAARLREPALDVSAGVLRSRHADFLPSGLPNLFDIDVPAGSAALTLSLRSTEPAASLSELHLYDCTTGECFSYDFTVPAAKRQRIEVRRPRPGRWVAAVNAAPFPSATGGFVLDEIITTHVERHAASSNGPYPRGRQWIERLDVSPGSSAPADATPVLVCELVDRFAERDAAAHPWENREGLTNFAERPVAAGMGVVRGKVISGGPYPPD